MATFTNQATLSYGHVTLTSNITTGELVEALTVDKVALLPTYGVEDTLTYVVSLVNSGQMDLNNLTLTDDLGGYAFNGTTLYPLTYVEGSLQYFVDGVQQSAPTVVAGPPMTVTSLRVPSQDSAVVVYQVRVNAFAPLESGSTVVNTVTVTGGGMAEGISAQETVSVTSGPDLSLCKEISPAQVMDSGLLTYTLTAQNRGNTAADSADLVIRDTFNPILSNLSVTFNDESWTEGTQYTYDQATGAFATVAGMVTVPSATFSQDPTTGAYSVTPGESVLVITGNV